MDLLHSKEEELTLVGKEDRRLSLRRRSQQSRRSSSSAADGDLSSLAKIEHLNAELSSMKEERKKLQGTLQERELQLQEGTEEASRSLGA